MNDKENFFFCDFLTEVVCIGKFQMSRIYQYQITIELTGLSLGIWNLFI